MEGERRKAEEWFYEIPLEAICRVVSRDTGIEEDGLYSVGRGRRGAAVRGTVAYLARRVSGYSVKEIGDHFRRSSVTISEAIRKVEDLLQKDKAFATRLELLIAKLIKGRKRKYRITEA